MRGTFGAAIGLLVLFAAGEARAVNRIIVVLPLDVRMTKGKLSAEAQSALEEMLRDVASDSLAPSGWTVLTGENTLTLLEENGIDTTKVCDESCHLKAARELKSELFISGAVQWSEGYFS